MKRIIFSDCSLRQATYSAVEATYSAVEQLQENRKENALKISAKYIDAKHLSTGSTGTGHYISINSSTSTGTNDLAPPIPATGNVIIGTGIGAPTQG